MSVSVERYNTYLCCMLIEGYISKHKRSSIHDIPEDITMLCAMYISIPFNYIIPTLLDIQCCKFQYLLFLFDSIKNKDAWKSITKYIISSSKSHKESTTVYLKNHSKSIIIQNHTKALKIFSTAVYFKNYSKNKQLIIALNICAKYDPYDHYCDQHGHYYEPNIYIQYNKYLNIIIDLSKKGICLRCKYMQQLIAMYEYYYFDFYVLKWIKYKIESEIESNKLMQAIQRNMNENISRMIDNKNTNDFVIDLEQWNNSNSMRMSTLMKIIAMEYNQQELESLMEELECILDFVRIKYQIVMTRLSNILNYETKQFREMEENMKLNKRITRAVKHIGDTILDV
eukprot:11718_1